MTALNTHTFQPQLIAMRTALLAQISDQRGGVLSRAEVAAEHFGHPEDSTAQLASERELEFALGERETAKLGAIEAALNRLQAGTYGLCTDCGKSIAPERLRVNPEAERCILCQIALERNPAP
jgi:DnaK suppressor protein